MSITFAPSHDAADITGWAVTHANDHGSFGAVHAAHGDCMGDLLEHNLRCVLEDCQIYGGQIDPIMAMEIPSMNVNSTNGAFIAKALGYSIDDLWDGLVFEAQDFHDRVLVAIMLSAADKGVAATMSVGAGGGSWFDGGRAAGYLGARLEELLVIAKFSLAHDRKVCAG